MNEHDTQRNKQTHHYYCYKVSHHHLYFNKHHSPNTTLINGSTCYLYYNKESKILEAKQNYPRCFPIKHLYIHTLSWCLHCDTHVKPIPCISLYNRDTRVTKYYKGLYWNDSLSSKSLVFCILHFVIISPSSFIFCPYQLKYNS